jgi:hypothetical protein
MPKYRVLFTRVTSITVDVEADDPDAAIEEASTEGVEGICAQCSGWDRPWSRDEDDELEPEAVTDVDTDEDVWSTTERWARIPAHQ